MAEKWEIEGPKVLDIGGEGETVLALKVGLVGGRVDIVTHDDSATARLEVHEVVGRPLQVTWTGSTLRVSHVKDDDGNLFETLKRRFASFGDKQLSARVSLSVPSTTEVGVSTISAEALVNGVRAEVRANTVSGVLTLDDITGDVKANTVSGDIECHGLTSGTARISSNSVSGDVTVRIPPGGGFDVTARTASGQVVIDGRKVTIPGSNRPGGQMSDGDKALGVKAHSVSGNVVVLRARSGQGDNDDTESAAG